MRSINRYCIFFLAALLLTACDKSESNDVSQTGQGGSMTRFAINGDRLYVVDQSNITAFDISGTTFVELSKVPVQPGLETIFSNGDYLYLGARDGMYIFSIANRDAPEFVFRYAHIVSCDPVVVQGNRAYVTLRTGTSCNVGSNALEILDITNPNSPTLILNYTLTSPHGLAVDGNRLFICEGSFGMEMYDISNEKDMQLLTHIKDVFAYDVIARDGLLTMTGEDGIFQYRYSTDNTDLTEISKITVNRAQQ